MSRFDVNISRMTLSDLESIKDILENEFDNFWNYSILKSELENPNSIYFVIKIQDKIIGFVGLLVVFDIVDITNIVIKKDNRGNGYSSALLEYIINYCKYNNLSQINLEVNTNNIIAINLYKKFNFVQVGYRKNYYKNEDALLFTKML